MKRYQLLQGDCREVLKTLPDNSVDSIVTDPPYELGFMGKAWDATGVAYDANLWREAFRVLKHGGHILSFGGSRTYHRMACAIEDAGFEVRDQIMWVYGSGFPKSHNISKAMDKNGGKDLTWFIDYVIKTAEEKGITRAELSGLFPSKNGNPTGWLWNKQNGQGITIEQYNKIKDFLCLPFKSIEEVERSVIGVGKAGLTKGNIANFAGKTEFEITAPATDEAKQWDGWGTALKPAHEPIVLARKPLEGTVAENVLKWGVGGLNIDGCRVDFVSDEDKKESTTKNQHEDFGTLPMTNNQVYGDYSMLKPKNYQPTGRFPANLIHDGHQQVLDLFPQSNGGHWSYKQAKDGGLYEHGLKDLEDGGSDKQGGSAARFFYCPKASKSDRDEGCEELPTQEKPAHMRTGNGTGETSMTDGFQPTQRKNTHPTVKPTELMRYLCRLITPPNGVVLDPFNGSGSTGKASMLEGMQYIGIEMNPEYIKIAEARISDALK